MNKLNKEDVQKIRKIQNNLVLIKNTGLAPISIIEYKKLGLIQSRYKKVKLSSGKMGKVFDCLILTQKGKGLLKIIL